jgi:penicillin-binding protein 1A
VRRNASFGRVIDPQYVAMMNQMMQETLLTGTARKAELPGWQAAGKTGTSQDWRDAWFLGYTSYLVAGVWLGNDDNSPTKKVSGGNLPVEIWSRFMKAAHEGVPVAGLPVGTWRSGEAQNPDASPTPPLNLTGAQMGTGGRGGRQPQPAPPPAPENLTPQARVIGPRGAPGANADGAPIPPSEIPNAGHGPPVRDKGLLDKLFGTL